MLTSIFLVLFRFPADIKIFVPLSAPLISRAEGYDPKIRKPTTSVSSSFSASLTFGSRDEACKSR